MDTSSAGRALLQQAHSGASLGLAGDTAEGDGKSMRTKANSDFIVSQEIWHWMASVYLGGANPCVPLASPLHAELSGMPPMFIQADSEEILLDDSTSLATRAQAVDEDLTHKIWNDMTHVWHISRPSLSEAEDGLHEAGIWLDRHLD